MLIKGPDDGKVSLKSAKAAGMKDYIVIKTAHPFIMKNKEAIANTIAFIKTGSFKN